MNDIVALAAAGARFFGGHGGYTDAFGYSAGPLELEPFWARVTNSDGGSPAAHGFVELIEDPVTHTFADNPSGISGTTTVLPLYATDGQIIATGTVLKIWRGTGEYYLGQRPGVAVSVAVVRVTSSTSQTITLTGGSISGYPAKVEAFSSATGAWSDGATCWFVGANGETPNNGTRYWADQVGQDSSGVPIYSTQSGLDVQSSTGTPDYPGTYRLQFDASTFTLSQPSPGVVKVVGDSGISGIAVLQDGSPGVGSTAEVNFLSNGHAGFVVTNVLGNATVDLAWAVYSGGGASLQLGVLNCNFTQLATNQFFNQNGGSGWYAFATSRISGLADYAFGIQDGLTNYPCYDLVQATPTGGSVTGYLNVGAHLLIATNAAPAHFNSPGIVGQLVADGGGNLYVCYATDRWAKINSDSISF